MEKPEDTSETQLKALKAAIVNRPPYCSGSLPLEASDLTLFYGKGDSAGFVHFSTFPVIKERVLI